MAARFVCAIGPPTVPRRAQIHPVCCVALGAALCCQNVPHATRGTGGALAFTKQLRAVQAMPCNTVCADCGAAQPDWASVNLGVLICLSCSGIHRSMGVHVSKVRSLTLDVWTPSCTALLAAIGNAKVGARRWWVAP